MPVSLMVREAHSGVNKVLLYTSTCSNIFVGYNRIIQLLWEHKLSCIFLSISFAWTKICYRIDIMILMQYLSSTCFQWLFFPFFFFELVLIQLSSCLGRCIFSLVFSIILCHSKGGIIKYGQFDILMLFWRVLYKKSCLKSKPYFL